MGDMDGAAPRRHHTGTVLRRQGTSVVTVPAGGTISKNVRYTAVIEPRQGDVLDADAEAIVNTVNCIGTMGVGVALRVKQAYLKVYADYRAACRVGKVQPGQMLVVPTGQPGNPKARHQLPHQATLTAALLPGGHPRRPPSPDRDGQRARPALPRPAGPRLRQ